VDVDDLLVLAAAESPAPASAWPDIKGAPSNMLAADLKPGFNPASTLAQADKEDDDTWWKPGEMMTA
jgi:hypothetical protein